MGGNNPGPSIPKSSASFTPAPAWAQNNVPANAQNTASIIGGSIQQQGGNNSQSNTNNSNAYTGTILGA